MERLVTRVITPEEEGRTVKALLREMGISRRQMTRLKARPGGILLDGCPVTVRRTVRAGNLLQLRLEGGEEGAVAPSPGPVDVVYEDDDILVVSKPAGLIVHPTHHHEADTLAGRLAARYAGRGFTFRCVTRLDKDTSGLTLVARHAVVASALTRMRSAGASRTSSSSGVTSSGGSCF